MRKSIFDIAAERLDMNSDTDRLIALATTEKTLYDGYFQKSYTLFDYVDDCCFSRWRYRGRYINAKDFLNALDFDNLVQMARHNLEKHLTLIELIYNFWNLAYNELDKDPCPEGLTGDFNFHHLKKVMDQILDENNHIAIGNEDNDHFIVVENKPEVTAVAEIMPTESLSLEVIKYNHRSLKGNIDLKRAILLKLGAEIEPKRSNLRSINSHLESDIFTLLNNLNIRHNNCAVNDQKNYKEAIAAMTTEQLEEWYDELYQMILLGFLLLDNVERSNKVAGLKSQI
ncbi:MAG: hypothetical protein PUJ21_08195 [Clostridia bacterium]|nr:hypothetical protein [Clostridia bacterium]MDY6184923.1 hypothetical protein [Eubacteriales bacterium]